MRILGIDEVGRGSWAGPLVAGAVVLGDPIQGLRDSKMLSKARRTQLADIIMRSAFSYGLGWVSALEIDELGLTKAVRLAYHRALAEIHGTVDSIIIDGNYNFLRDDPRATTLVKADDLVPSVSAASIIAKVARDSFMARMSGDYPGYGFERHVGYGTAFHRAALGQFGPCLLHRRSFRPVSEITSFQ